MPVHLPATSSVWAISDTANTTVTIARGLLEAATSDDISPVALLACASFGSLLPVSPETRLKIEQLARRNHTSHVLNFIKAQIGYRKDDSVEQLSRSDSGIRFLCLVATLCTLDRYDAADRLDSLLQATQQGFQIRPTIRQLQVMLDSMKTKLIMSDFATSVAGFEMFLRASLAGSPSRMRIALIPTKKSLQDLVMAMNQLGRIAEEDSIETVEVRLNSCYAPWTCAFIKWLLGVPPLVRTAQGKTLLQQDNASITLTILSPGSNSTKRTADGKAKLEVVPVQTIWSLREIIFLHPGTSEPELEWQGLVSVQVWFDYQFSILFDKIPQLRKEGKLRNALGQALYFIVTTLPERLVFCENLDAFESTMLHRRGDVEDMFHPTAPKAFLNLDVRLRIAKELVKGHVTLVQEDNDENGTMLPHNLGKALKSGCGICQKQTIFEDRGGGPCKVHQLLEGIGELGSMLLTLSLFGPHPAAFPMLRAVSDDYPVHPKLYPLPHKQVKLSVSFSNLITTGWQALMHGGYAYLSCRPITIFQHAAKMMGHQRTSASTIISSLYGQVLFPAFFEARDFFREGCLQMSAFPGKLQKDGMQFDFLVDHSFRDEIDDRDNLDIIEIDIDDTELEKVVTDPEGEGHDRVGRTGSGSTGDYDEQMEEVDLEEPEEDREEERDSNNESQSQPDFAPMSTTNVNAYSTAREPVPFAFAGARRRLVLSAEVMQWSISVREAMLHGELRFHGYERLQVIPWKVINSLFRARLSPACPHPYNNPAGELADSFELDPNKQGDYRHYRSVRPRSLKMAGQDYARQLDTLQRQGEYPAVIVHVDGCIQCAMRLGLADRVRVVIS
ncbi:hypothetical protein LTR99_010157 [Exophiala xenobiotica]|uniref:Uncharacterized protein n=1 Tax=Vermiconidia calcicola TaxID=1690605 RepID=A0AAV9PYJ8_9PEZI|nr:hypothetical protein LTR99_010157 [Exophiala xenobiotica]KAK5426785.1 hypothetical protein LTR34_009733 [Exophiala xenobiotica]KAK5529438.1 hypothetical protein LTR25_009684 [Vermiconidia calcicola]KAK5538023.1 hypothetical protein LTR23_007317 [Chaetothyriales sp. CCFEE 6169]